MGMLHLSAPARAPELRRWGDCHQARKMGTRRAALRAQSPPESLTSGRSVRHRVEHAEPAANGCRSRLRSRKRCACVLNGEVTGLVRYAAVGCGTRVATAAVRFRMRCRCQPSAGNWWSVTNASANWCAARRALGRVAMTEAVGLNIARAGLRGGCPFSGLDVDHLTQRSSGARAGAERCSMPIGLPRRPST
jgi:hypothetical protein